MNDALVNRVQNFELVEELADFVTNLRYEDLSERAIATAKIFIMDSLAVGVAGTTYDATDKAASAAATWGQGETPTIGRPGLLLPRPAAAFVNGMQIHALEWDGLHEPSVVIALCVPLGAMAAELGRQGITGKALILATVIAIEVGVFFGGDTASGPRFFRPSCAGGMGATAAMSRLRGFDQSQLIHALGLAHAQTAGTMQAHWEGSMALPMQIGNAARMAHMAVDMVEAGMTGPVDFIDGRFGYFKLFESGGDIKALLANLGRPFKITEVAHKPYPAGRATQATLTMVRDLIQAHDFSPDDIEQIKVFVPPLIVFLVGRPAQPDMTPSYARLCLRFVVPLMLLDGEVEPRRYIRAAFEDPKIVALGERIQIIEDDNPDENALGPQRMEMVLKSGRRLEAHCVDPLGSPGNPLSKQQREDKVRQCFALQLPDAEARAEKFIQASNDMHELQDVRMLLDLVT